MKGFTKCCKSQRFASAEQGNASRVPGLAAIGELQVVRTDVILFTVRSEATTLPSCCDPCGAVNHNGQRLSGCRPQCVTSQFVQDPGQVMTTLRKNIYKKHSLSFKWIRDTGTAWSCLSRPQAQQWTPSPFALRLGEETSSQRRQGALAQTPREFSAAQIDCI